MRYCSYSQLVSDSGAYITVSLDLKQPVEITDFARLFASLGDQFDAYIADNYPDISGKVKIFVKEVRKGSIIADIVPQIRDMVDLMDAVLIVTGFSGLVSWKIKEYISGRKIGDFGKSDIEAVTDMVKSVAHDSNGKATIENVILEQGVWTRKLSVSFTTSEARQAVKVLESHKSDLEKTESADHRRVTMVFERSSTRDASVGKRSGERVIIDAISDKAQALIYASEMAERQIKHEIREADDNVFKKAFVVDVNVESRGGQPIGYRVTQVHQVIDLPES